MTDDDHAEPPDGPRGRVGPGQYVRPHASLEDWPVIRRIGDRDCYVGNWLAADPERHDRSFDFVLSATEERQPATTHHHPMVDGEADWPAFAAAVDDARKLLRRDGSLLVHCKAGISRSSTVLATAIASEEGRRFLDALDEIQTARPHAAPHPEMQFRGVVYLAARE